MATFTRLDIESSYLIVDGETGHSKGDGIQGADVMASEWNEGDEAWPAGEEEFRGRPSMLRSNRMNAINKSE